MRSSIWKSVPGSALMTQLLVTSLFGPMMGADIRVQFAIFGPTTSSVSSFWRNRNSSTPLSGTVAVATWWCGTVPGDMRSDSHPLKLPVIAKKTSSSSTGAAASALSHLAGMSGGSAELKVIVYLSFTAASKSGPSVSQSAGSSPIARTSGGGSFASLRRTISLTFGTTPRLSPQKTMWPLVPPKPKDEMWMLFCVFRVLFSSLLMHMSNWVCSRLGLSCLKWQMPMQQAFFTCRVAAMMVVMAAPPSRWPVCVLFVTMRSVVLRFSLTWTLRTPPTSIGSPREVPVPWQHQMQDSTALIFPSRSVLLMSSSCAIPFGAVMVAERPFCPHLDARHTASRSSSRRPNLSVTPEQPSPRM
mmetsp:Transcript_12950/g.36733  ORF Transcript_12950/g.36733 Transcript_12950/m.36733 type:complete len:358 (-) Transcript_12950:1804-2877(-)